MYEKNTARDADGILLSADRAGRTSRTIAGFCAAVLALSAQQARSQSTVAPTEAAPGGDALEEVAGGRVEPGQDGNLG